MPEARLPPRRTPAPLTGPHLQHPSPSTPGAPSRRQPTDTDADASDCTAPPRPTGSAHRSSTARPPRSSRRPQPPRSPTAPPLRPQLHRAAAPSSRAAWSAPWGEHGFAGGPSGGGDAVEGWWRCLEAAAARVPPCRQRRATRGWKVGQRYRIKQEQLNYSLRPILLFANTDASIIKICLDTSILTKSNINRRE
jgi:hypothetical protein